MEGQQKKWNEGEGEGLWESQVWGSVVPFFH